MPYLPADIDYSQLADQIKEWSVELGFQQLGISDIALEPHETHLLNWLKKGFHGEMFYMENHGTKRSRPNDLVEGTIRVISVRMDYRPPEYADSETVMSDDSLGFISRYALGRDYHKVMRKKLQTLSNHIQQTIGDFGYRVFVDSAPVLEKALAEKSGLGWIGKHSNLINSKAGSWFFLGEIYTDLPLPVNGDVSDNHCGTCQACIDICPTDAIIAPYQVDARKCISYLTIELKGAIPIEFRKAMGNRIYGCDDCQLVCPWNRFSEATSETDFNVRHQLDAPELTTLFKWSEETFLKNTEGSAIRRIGYDSWLRNIAIALGNGSYSEEVIAALTEKRQAVNDMVAEHIDWALDQLEDRTSHS